MHSFVHRTSGQLGGHDRARTGGWPLLIGRPFSVFVVALFVATAVAIWCQDWLLVRSTVITPGSSTYVPRFYGDGSLSGGSTVEVMPRHPLQWRCTLRGRYKFPFCSYDLILDHLKPGRGLDLSHLESVGISLDYEGPADTFRFTLKNFDSRYSEPGKPETLKLNKAEVSVRKGHNDVQLGLPDFSVAEWWVTARKLKPELSRLQFDNIVQVQFQTATAAPNGRYAFGVNRIVLRQRVLSQPALYGLILAVWAVVGACFVYRLRYELERGRQSQAAALRSAEHAEEAARRDHLTKLLNRAGLLERYRMMSNNRRGSRSHCAILIDVDHFKSINDRYGHAVGDEVICAVADLLAAETRDGDAVGRWGGEEFLLICSPIDLDGALSLAEKLRHNVEAHEFGSAGSVTISLGVYWGANDSTDLNTVVSWADAALYEAKAQGRNRFVLYEPAMHEDRVT